MHTRNSAGDSTLLGIADRRKLKKISTRYKPNAPKRLLDAPDGLQVIVGELKKPLVQHARLVNDEHAASQDAVANRWPLLDTLSELHWRRCTQEEHAMCM